MKTQTLIYPSTSSAHFRTVTNHGSIHIHTASASDITPGPQTPLTNTAIVPMAPNRSHSRLKRTSRPHRRQPASLQRPSWAGIPTTLPRPKKPNAALAEGPQARETTYVAPISTLLLRQLDRLSPDDRRRLAKQRGLEWPTTEQARDQLFDTIADVLRHGDARVVDAPTSLGKSYAIASTRWDAREDLTGGKSVIYLSKTCDAREEAVATAKSDGGQYFLLLSRDEACPVAAGEYDPPADGDVEIDYTPITIEG